MAVQRKFIDKGLLKNVIRHTDAHNKIQEENEMWKQFELMNNKRRDTSALVESKRFVGRMRCDSEDGDQQPKTSYWTQQLFNYEANDSGRWGHSGYRELYPEEFENKASQEKIQKSKKRKTKKEKRTDSKSRKSRKRKREEKKASESDSQRSSEESEDTYEYERKRKRINRSSSSERSLTDTRRKGRKTKSKSNAKEENSEIRTNKERRKRDSSTERSQRTKTGRKKQSREKRNAKSFDEGESEDLLRQETYGRNKDKKKQKRK